MFHINTKQRNLAKKNTFIY